MMPSRTARNAGFPLLAILCLLTSLLVPGIASASTAAGAETRVWAFDLADQARIGGSASLTLELNRGCAPTYDDLASDSLLAARGGASLPTKPGQLGHIFRNAPGHLADTPANRQLLADVASNSANWVGVDRFGNVWSSVTRADGTQVWASTRNGVIQNGGLNQVPQAFPNIVRP